MKNSILDLVPFRDAAQLPSEVLSLRPFVEYVRNAYNNASRSRQRFLSFVSKRIESKLGSSGLIDPERVADYSDLWQLIYSCTNPILGSDDAQLWALAMPVSPRVFYSTDSFFNTLVYEDGTIRNNLAALGAGEMTAKHIESAYSLILQRCYHAETLLRQDMIFPFEEEGVGITRYFKISFDDRFIEISYTGEAGLPTIDLTIPDKKMLLAQLMEKLPLSMFRYEGLCLVTVIEVTPHYAVENIKKSLLENVANPGEADFTNIIKSLQTLAKTRDVEFGLFPFLKVNNRHIFSEKASLNSLLIRMFQQQGMEKENYYFCGQNYLSNPQVVLIKDIKTVKNDRFCIDTLNVGDIRGYALEPIYFNDKLCGVLEIYSRVPGVIDEMLLTRIEPALPFIAQIYQKSIDDFENEIEAVIKRNFTSVQPAVQWRFNEAAWHFIRDQYGRAGRRPEIENISFEHVFPLYGAVDLKNSTIERNEALRKDLSAELSILKQVLSDLREKSGFPLIDEKIYQADRWLKKLNEPDGYTQDSRLNDFLETEVNTFLENFLAGTPSLRYIADNYFAAIDPEKGEAYENRRRLEKSMTQVIGAVNNYMDLMKDEMQKSYPCYFEKFRTDGVEYDVYIGQSLAPEKPFSEIYLGNLRLMQLESMAAIAKFTHAVKEQLPIAVDTTQLIFIHSHPIDIVFRRDEKRFDVEGAYNIRYHIVKKRIDKVHIKGTRNRLVAPGKIAMVYFTQKEADEYVSYIRYLVQKGVLADDLEFLDLELLQGVSGLKAMRVGVNMLY